MSFLTISKNEVIASLDAWKPSILSVGRNVLVGIAILLVAHIIGRWAQKSITRRGEAQNQNDETVVDDERNGGDRGNMLYVIVGGITYYTLLVIGITTVLRLFGVEVTSIIALIGAAGFGIGLALQGTLNDVTAGVLMALYNTYSIGDIIGIEDTVGQVYEYTLLHTIVKDIDSDVLVTIPNRKIQDNIVQNITRQPRVVLPIDVLVSNKNKDYRKIANILVESTKDQPGVLGVRNVGVESMSEVGTMMRIRVWVDSRVYRQVRLPLRLKMREMLDEAGIEMTDPF